MEKNILQKEFFDWLGKHGVSSHNVYWSRLSSLLAKRLLSALDSGSLSSDLAKKLQPLKGNFWGVVVDLIERGYINYAIYVCELYLDALGEIRGEADSNNDIMTALRRFVEFLKSCVSLFVGNGTAISKVADRLTSSLSKSLVAPYDANMILAYSMPDFIERAVESSLFFDENIIAARQSEMEALFSAGINSSIPARCWRGTKPTNPLVKPDYAGNNATRQVIKNYTGYEVSGKAAQLVGYNISHVWGQATEPGFFTNLWNLSLIPAWANHLMDVPAPFNNSLASQLQNTIRAICFKLYNMSGINYGKLQIANPPCVDANQVIKGNYNINIICGKGKHKLGPIVKKMVFLP